jgi:hypothetical protein
LSPSFLVNIYAGKEGGGGELVIRSLSSCHKQALQAFTSIYSFLAYE